MLHNWYLSFAWLCRKKWNIDAHFKLIHIPWLPWGIPWLIPRAQSPSKVSRKNPPKIKHTDHSTNMPENILDGDEDQNFEKSRKWLLVPPRMWGQRGAGPTCLETEDKLKCQHFQLSKLNVNMVNIVKATRPDLRNSVFQNDKPACFLLLFLFSWI